VVIADYTDGPVVNLARAFDDSSKHLG
jgi:hypothetical protein